MKHPGSYCFTPSKVLLLMRQNYSFKKAQHEMKLHAAPALLSACSSVALGDASGLPRSTAKAGKTVMGAKVQKDWKCVRYINTEQFVLSE